MKFINKTFYQIIFFCFIAESFSKIILLITGILVYKTIGFDGYIITRRGPAGCLDVNWQMSFMFFWHIVYAYTLLFASYSISKKGFETQKTILILIGSLLFFPMLKGTVETIVAWYNHNPLWFLVKKVEFSNKLLPLFGNLYNLKIAQFISWIIQFLITIFVGYQIVKKFWNKELRIKFFTIGAVAAVGGGYFWYQFLGKLVVMIFK